MLSACTAIAAAIDMKNVAHSTAINLLRLLPLISLVALNVFICLGYELVHLKRLLSAAHGSSQYVLGIVESIIFHCLVAMLTVCFVLAWLVHPGSIPDEPPVWSIYNTSGAGLPELYERKAKEPDTPPPPPPPAEAILQRRRTCKWCQKIKPDRTHHCSRCQTCILRMDHHCPWINNCVGWKNHKYFFLTIFYAWIYAIFVATTQIDTIALYTSLESDTSHGVTMTGLWLLSGTEWLAGLLGIALSGYLPFVSYLLFNNKTTLEFCEQHMPNDKKKFVAKTNWSQGCLRNIRLILGNNPLLWLIPIDNKTTENGCSFPPGQPKPLDPFQPSDSTLEFHIEEDQQPMLSNNQDATNHIYTADGQHNLNSDERLGVT